MTERELIDAARHGDEGAIASLYRRHADRVFTIARRLAGDDALAEDWAQEAWVRAIRSLSGFRGDAKFTTWLHRITVNSALIGERSRRRLMAREAAGGEQIVSRWGEDRPLDRMHLQRALDRLPPGMRRVLVLHDVEGYTHEEIGEMLGVASGTCKSQLFKARAKMRTMLKEQMEGERM